MDTETLEQLATQQNIIIQQNATTNDYLSTLVVALYYLGILASFLTAYMITRGRN